MKTQISVLLSKVNSQLRSQSHEFYLPYDRIKFRNVGNDEYFNSSCSKLCFFHTKFREKLEDVANYVAIFQKRKKLDFAAASLL